MKKGIINIATICSIIIISLITNRITLYAHQKEKIEAITQEDYNDTYEIRKTKIPLEETMLIKDEIDKNGNIIKEGESVKAYLSKKYPSVDSSNWKKKESNSTMSTTGNIPIEMQGKDFPESIITQAIEELRNEEYYIPSSYGGCGPIATMGIVEYFAKTFPYYNIAHTSEKDKLAIAKSILVNTITYELFGGTFSHPYDCSVGFNETMRIYGLENTIIATDYGISVEQYEKVAKVKEQINKGLPVSMYALNATDNGSVKGSIDNHYVNIYGYQEWNGYDSNGNHFTNTIFVIRPNWNQDGYVVYADSSILFADWTGIIYYDIVYDKKQLNSHSFNSFVNDNNQGQYFNDEKEQEIYIFEDFSFNTKRLRCSYIENEYLVLSTIKKNGVYTENERETAYLEFQFSEPIMKFEYDISLWSGKEKITNDTTGELQYFSNLQNKWITVESYNMMILPIRDYPKHFFHYLSLKENAYRLRFIMSHPKVDADRNKGRIVLDNIDLCFDNHNQLPHTHQYDNHYVSNEFETHTAYCLCGKSTLQNHTLFEENGIVKCQYCDYTHAHQYLFEQYNDIQHKRYCECGDFYLETHTLFEENNLVKCQYCDFEHMHQYTCEQYNDTQHKWYCECGDFYLENHNMTESSSSHSSIVCLDCGMSQDSGHVFTNRYGNKDMIEHIAYCVCGESITEKHEFNDYYINDENYHELFCRCGNSLMFEHTFDNRYEQKDDNMHIAHCACGARQEQNHTVVIENGMEKCLHCNYEKEHIHQYSYTENNDIHHSKVCEQCGEFLVEEHIIDNFDCHYEDDEYHTLHCICSYTIYEAHDYSYTYQFNDEQYHKAFCICMGYTLVPHYYEDGSDKCLYCGYQREHIHHYVYEEYDEVKHEVYCECGENYREAHVIDNPSTGHFTIRCNYCDAKIYIGCIYKDHYEYYSENEHFAYCICGDVILKEHTYNEDGTCIYCHC